MQTKNHSFTSMFKYSTHALAHSRCLRPFLHQESLLPGTTVLGWGHKPTADKARHYAAQHGLPYIALEDGFLRSVGLGCQGAQPLSLVVDHTGIYYDAHSPSDLETLLNSSGWEQSSLLQDAQRAMEAIIRLGLSKYNHAPDAPKDLWQGAPSPRVLVLDQTLNDASITLGLADDTTFWTMLDEVLAAYPAASILVKTHPDVIAGKKQGHLAEYAAQLGVHVLGEDCAPLSLLAQADVVYTVTSQMGFEALLLGKEVHCYGMPFYAGWGLTQDRQSCPRRKRQRSLVEVFAAAYLLYARYVHPVREERCDIHEVIALLAEQKRQNDRNRTFHACLGFAWWKRPYARAFLHSTGGEIAFYSRRRSSVRRALADAQARGGEVVVWSSATASFLQKGCDLQAECDAVQVPLARMEDGFIRSVGLGSDFNWPYSLVVDRKGIYYAPSRPSDLEDILNALPQHPDRETLLQRARALRKRILETGLTKYNTGKSTARLPDIPSEKPIVLVPGQVEDDASVRCAGFGMSNFDLIKAVRNERPEAFILYKPHPDVESGNRQGAIPEQQALQYADCVLHDFPMGQLLPLVQEVHTLTSQTGFEALLRGVAVFTYGGPFYAGWGLTQDRQDFPRRKARLTLDELVAGVLLLYPTYYDWQTRSFCRAEDVCFRLLQPGGQLQGRIWSRLVTAVRRLGQSLLHLGR